MSPSHQDRNELQRAALERATEAAKKKDPVEFLSAVAESHFIDGATGRLQSQYPGLDPDSLHEVISGAIDQFYEEVSAGGVVRRPVTWLWKSIKGRAFDLIYRTWAEEVPTDPSHLSTATETVRPSSILDEVLEGVEVDEDDVPEERIRALALQVARRLLPQLGQQNVQAVMAYLFEAVEQGVEDVTNEEIGEALGLELDTVRYSKSRGWKRLERIVRDQGIGDTILSRVGVHWQEVEEEEDE